MIGFVEMAKGEPMRLIDADTLGLTDMEIIMCNGDYKEALKMLIDKIEHAPTIEERKKGEWIELTNTNHTYVCSACGRMLVNITDGKNMVMKNYPFCHCGADMRKG